MDGGIDEAVVRRVAGLARLKLTDDEVHRLAGELSAILGYVQQLNEVNTEGVEPTAHPLPLRNVWREDEPQPSLGARLVLSNAPQAQEDFFRVPKVLDQDGEA